MAAESDSPLVPCSSCGQHHAAGETACPHCGAARGMEATDAKTRRLFLYTALGAGALGAAGVAAFWDRIRSIFGGAGGGRGGGGVLYGPPQPMPRQIDSPAVLYGAPRPQPTPIQRPPDNGGEEYGVPRDRVRPPVSPPEPALADAEVAEAHGRHAMADYDAAIAAYQKVLQRTPPFAQAARVRAWLEDAQAHRPPRQ